MCAPFHVLVTGGSNYSVSINADQSVIDALDAAVASEQLRIGTSKAFSTQQPIQVTVTVPGDLQTIHVPAALIAVYVEGSAVAPAFNATITGPSLVALLNLNVTDLSIVNWGYVGNCCVYWQQNTTYNNIPHSVGTIFANGSIDDAKIGAFGPGNITLDGVQGTVETVLYSPGNLYVNPSGGA